MSVFLLLIVVCPLMMFFMMRGMGGMKGMHGGHDDAQQLDPNSPNQVGVPADRRDQRLAELEREVAELRASRERADAGR